MRIDPFHTEHFDPEETPGAGTPPEATPPASPPAPAEPPSPWSGPSQEEWQQLVQFQQTAAPVLQELAQVLQGGVAPPPAAPAQPEPQSPPFDPFNPESVQQYIDQVAEQKAQALLEPYMGVLGLTASQTGEQLARETLTNLKGEFGEFDQDMALMVAAGLLDQGAQPEQALRAGAEYVSNFEKRLRGEQLQQVVEPRLPGATPPGQPPGGSPANEVQQVPTGPGRYEKVVENWMATRRPQLPVG